MSISIGKHVYSKLSSSQILVSLVCDKINALSTKTATTFPFVVFRRASLTPSYTKDGHSGDNTTVEIVVASDNYLNSVEILESVRSALECKRGKYDTFDVVSAKVISSSEDFIEDTFIQSIIFSFETE